MTDIGYSCIRELTLVLNQVIPAPRDAKHQTLVLHCVSLKCNFNHSVEIAAYSFSTG